MPAQASSDIPTRSLTATSSLAAWAAVMAVAAGGAWAQADSTNIPQPDLPEGATAEPISRNAPCPCGSGKKFKHCHGQLA